MRDYRTPAKSASVPFKAEGVVRGFVARVGAGGVFVRVPRLSGDFEYGPLEVAGSLVAPLRVGDSVFVGFLEGRQDDLVVLGVVDSPHRLPSRVLPAFPARSGFWVSDQASEIGSVSPGNGIVTYAPLFLGSGGVIDRLAVDVMDAGSDRAVCRLGIYEDAGHMAPGRLLADLGTVEAETRRVAEVPLGSPLEVGAGVLFLAAVTQGGPARLPTYRATVSSVGFVGWSVTAAAALSGASHWVATTEVLGGLPANAEVTVHAAAQSPAVVRIAAHFA